MGGWRLLPSGSLKSALRGPHGGAGPLRCLAAPASRLPPRVMQPSGLRPSPTDAAAETGRWATSHRDVAAPKGEPSLASPLGGGAPPVGGGEGTPLARGPAFGEPPSWHSAVRERRGKAPVSLAFFPALRAYKVKGKVAPFLKKRRPKKLLRSLRSASCAHVRFSLAQARRSAAAPWRELRAQALGKTFTLAAARPPCVHALLNLGSAFL